LLIYLFSSTRAWTWPTPWATLPAQPFILSFLFFFFVMGFLKIKSLELFAQAGLEPQSSWSLPP
jgi:hypothetical protein